MQITSKIYHLHESNQDKPRSHLGASVVGKKCTRAIWLDWRWASPNNFDGRLLRLFETGHLAEERMIKELRAIGVEVLDVNPSTGKQWNFTDINGHFSGSCDGVIKVDGEWMLLECKTHNDKSFKELKEKGVINAKIAHVAQMMIYMHYLKLPKALYLAVNKNTDELYEEVLEYDQGATLPIIEMARSIITTETVPERISDNPTWYECKMCNHYNLCHQGYAPQANCRTCAYVTPVDNGQWKCERENALKSYDEQLNGCNEHIIIPPIITQWKPLQMDNKGVTYQNDAGQTWVNCQNSRYVQNEKINGSEGAPF